MESQVDQTDFFNVGMGRDIKYKPYRKLFNFIDWLVFGLIDWFITWWKGTLHIIMNQINYTLKYMYMGKRTLQISN